MASENVEIVKSVAVSFGVINGEEVVVGPAIDVADDEVVNVQVNVQSSNAASDTDVTWRCDTSLTTDNFPKFEACFTAKNVPKTAGQASVARIDENSTNPLRRFLRVVFIHNVTTAGQTVIVQVIMQRKKRVP